MRRVSRFLARGVSAVVVVTILAAPIAEARTRDDGPGFLGRSRIIKILKKWVGVVSGDLMSDPKP